MNEKKRMGLMLGVLLVLIVANLYFRLGGDGIGAGLFSDDTDLEEAWSAKALRNLTLLETLPELSFSIQKPDSSEKNPERNPFVFGADRRREHEARDRLQQLAETRKDVEEKAAPAAEVVAEAPPKVTFDGEIMGTLQDSNSGKFRVSVHYKHEYYTLSVGDVLAERFKVLSIQENQVRFSNLKDGEEITVKIKTQTR